MQKFEQSGLQVSGFKFTFVVMALLLQASRKTNVNPLFCINRTTKYQAENASTKSRRLI